MAKRVFVGATKGGSGFGETQGSAEQRQGRTTGLDEARHRGDPHMPIPTANNTKRDAFIKAVVLAARVGDITHFEARELIQEWFDMYPGPDELSNRALVFSKRFDSPV
jgi:hypothetical protein